MRPSALVAPLALLAGCNWVFGLDETKPRPDAPPLDAAWRVIHLNLLQATLDPAGKPQPPIEVAIPDLASAGAGAIAAGGALTPVDASTGTFTVPPEITGGPWRVVYQRAGGIPHEFQNMPDAAHLIEASWGPLARSAPEPTTGYVLKPTGAGIDHSINRVFTVGTWTEGSRLPFVPGTDVDYDYPVAAASLSGPLGAPAPGDNGVLVDFRIDGGGQCRTSNGSMQFDASNIGPPKPNIPGTFLVSGTAITVTTDTNVLSPIPLSPLGDETQLDATEQYGFVPSDQMPMFTRPPETLRHVHVENPVMLALRSCLFPVGTFPTVHIPTLFSDNLPQVVHTEVTTVRTLASNAQLVNGLSIVARPITGMTFDVRSEIAFAGTIKLDTTDLMGPSEAVVVGPAADGVRTLTWQKTKPTAKADFWQVTLVEINGAIASPRRVYTTLTPSLSIVAADLTTGHTYAFAVAAFTGRAPAATGDFRGISDSQAMTVIDSRTFVP